MDVGMMMVFASYGWENCSDERVWDEEIRLARTAADLGFDCLWAAEHHFNDYSFIPDNIQLMTYMTAVCPNIDIGTAAVILPWHDPLRVAEQAAVLDNLSKGRFRFGMGRGLARRDCYRRLGDLRKPLDLRADRPEAGRQIGERIDAVAARYRRSNAAAVDSPRRHGSMRDGKLR